MKRRPPRSPPSPEPPSGKVWISLTSPEGLTRRSLPESRSVTRASPSGKNAKDQGTSRSVARVLTSTRFVEASPDPVGSAVFSPVSIDFGSPPPFALSWLVLPQAAHSRTSRTVSNALQPIDAIVGGETGMSSLLRIQRRLYCAACHLRR